MASSYRALFARTGARSLALACALGWFSFASYGLAVVPIVAGSGYGLLNVAVFELLEDLVASSRAVEAFTWLTTWAGAGLAAGAALAGQLSVGGGAGRPLVAVAVPSVLAAAVALGRRSALAV